MADTYTLIEKITVGAAGTSDITFTSIPQTYTDLLIKVSLRTARTSDAGGDDLKMYFNGDFGSNYTTRTIVGNGATASSETLASSNLGIYGMTASNAGTANTFGNGEYYIPNYTSSSNKSASADTVSETNATTAYMRLSAGLWANTSAITSITFRAGSTLNFLQYSTAYLYGIAKEGVNPSLPSAPYATGGDSILFDGTYWIHTFTSSGTFTPKKSLTCDYLVVAGGGGGGTYYAGGGGAGGMRCTVTATGGGGSLESALSLAANTGYTVTVGAGGAGAPQQTDNSTNGSNSVFSTITATGGGRGPGYAASSPAGNTGGSGGGGRGSNGGTGGAGTANQGYAGGNGNASGNGGGGGGGAGAVGANAGTAGAGGAGGAGVATSITGSSVTYAGGGGGSAGDSGSGGAGGAGGGGAGALNANATAGTANTGGGGGATSNSSATNSGGAGGSGIVIVRYAA